MGGAVDLGRQKMHSQMQVTNQAMLSSFLWHNSTTTCIIYHMIVLWFACDQDWTDSSDHLTTEIHKLQIEFDGLQTKQPRCNTSIHAVIMHCLEMSTFSMFRWVSIGHTQFMHVNFQNQTLKIIHKSPWGHVKYLTESVPTCKVSLHHKYHN